MIDECCTVEFDLYTGREYEVCDVHGWKSDKWRFPCPLCHRSRESADWRVIDGKLPPNSPQYPIGEVRIGALERVEVKSAFGRLLIPTWVEKDAEE